MKKKPWEKRAVEGNDKGKREEEGREKKNKINKKKRNWIVEKGLNPVVLL